MSQNKRDDRSSDRCRWAADAEDGDGKLPASQVSERYQGARACHPRGRPSQFRFAGLAQPTDAATSDKTWIRGTTQ